MGIIYQFVKKVFYKKARHAHIMAFLRYNSITKFLNFVHNEYERRTKKIVLSSKPYLINSEPSGYCNYKCPFCPSSKENKRQGGFSDVDLYEKTIKEIGLYTYLMTIHGWGEPLFNKKLPDIIRLAHEHKIFTVVTTNVSLLTSELSREIISAKLDYLVLSIDGASQESYEKYRYGGNFETVMNNLKELISLKKELHSSIPYVEWQFIVFKHNEHEIKAAKKMACKLGVDNIIFMPAYTEDKAFDASDKKYHLPKDSPLAKRNDCKHLWSTLSFHWNGNVVPCCYDYNGRISYGNLVNDNFNQIWNNNRFQESRKIIKYGTENYSKELFCNFCVRSIPTNSNVR